MALGSHNKQIDLQFLCDSQDHSSGLAKFHTRAGFQALLLEQELTSSMIFE